MRRVRAWIWRLGDLVRGRDREADMAEELESHLQLHVEAGIRTGMTPEQARREAILKLGGLEATKEAYRDRRGFPVLEHFLRDVSYALRSLRRAPAFTVAAVTTLALGIGANAAIFSVVNAVLLRPLPYPEPDRLVAVWATDSHSGASRDVQAYMNFVDLRAQTTAFDRMAAYAVQSVVLSGAAGAELASSVKMTPGLFDTLGVHVAIGRPFRADEQQEQARVVILNDAFWARQFRSRPSALGEAIQINEDRYTVIGVMPRGFQLDVAEPEAIYLPLPIDPQRGHGFLRVVGHLKPGTSIGSAQAECNVVAAHLAVQYPGPNRYLGMFLEPLIDATVGSPRVALLILWGVVALVLVIACTNVANLMFARATSRQREMAVRAALGAGRSRLVRQLLTESLVLAAAGGALGLLLAGWSTSVLKTLLTDAVQIPRLQSAHVDGWVLAFTALVSSAAAIAFGVAPALSAASPDLADGLHESSRSATGGVRTRRLRRSLVIVETALALVLLVGAGVLLRTLFVMRSTPPGFDASKVLVSAVWLPQPRFESPNRRAAYYNTLLGRVGTLAGVESAALVADLPLGGSDNNLGFRIVGRPDPPSGYFSAGFNIASADYFKTLRIPIVEGREFSSADGPGTGDVVVINQAAARRFWPGVSPLGQRILLGSNGSRPDRELTVIAVTGDVHHIGLMVPPREEFFVNSRQTDIDWPWMVMVTRVKTTPEAMVHDVRALVASTDAGVPVLRVTPMSEIVAGTMAEPGLYAMLLGIFAAVALSLAAVGLYGLLTYTVSQRAHEMGIRLALGAAPGEILRLVLREGLTLAGAGAGIGLLLAFVATRSLQGLVQGLDPGSPLPFALVTLLLMLVAVVASVLPARRAACVDPLTSLRAE
jgi:putative ABC transport system permease protein